jgi:hypothetical protein
VTVGVLVFAKSFRRTFRSARAGQFLGPIDRRFEIKFQQHLWEVSSTAKLRVAAAAAAAAVTAYLLLLLVLALQSK